MSDKAHDGWQLTVFLCILAMTIGSCTAYTSEPTNECGTVQSKEATK